ncbi:ABC transporter permease [Paracrocinitomix mangrovi]|uniref:ABC transporter permease n=1 Tax=Paracrocinitomix mangrovi TaxID=2862509 RepID=UPI001C8D2C99|nr:ABC transporter permease [Paracrocinitomix mangrovi]UKN03650.1 ABC transporter permease [Paracrocinitomix mangrovi]
MMKLLKIEWLKVKNYNTFWWILGIYAVLVPVTFLSLIEFFLSITQGFPFFPSKEEILGFPQIWNYTTWIASSWNILLGVLVVILVCNDFAFKTQRQSVIDGLSRRDFILGKFSFLIVLAVVITLYTFLFGFIIGSIYSNISDFTDEIYYLLVYFIQTVGYFAFAFLWAVLIRRPALSIILFVVIILFDGILLNIPNFYEVAQFIPTITISQLVPFPFGQEFIDAARAQGEDVNLPFQLNQLGRSVFSSIFIIGFVLISYISLKRRDL